MLGSSLQMLGTYDLNCAHVMILLAKSSSPARSPAYFFRVSILLAKARLKAALRLFSSASVQPLDGAFVVSIGIPPFVVVISGFVVVETLPVGSACDTSNRDIGECQNLLMWKLCGHGAAVEFTSVRSLARGFTTACARHTRTKEQTCLHTYDDQLL